MNWPDVCRSPRRRDRERWLVINADRRRGGELGKPFMETEDDEEWTGWIDWSALGSGSSDAAYCSRSSTSTVGRNRGVQGRTGGRNRGVRGPRDVTDAYLVGGLLYWGG